MGELKRAHVAFGKKKAFLEFIVLGTVVLVVCCTRFPL
jgi:hypothetical protein